MVRAKKDTPERDTAEHVYLRVNSKNWAAVRSIMHETPNWRRLVFNAHHFYKNSTPIENAGQRQAEIVLDLQVGETAAAGRFRSLAGKLPWARTDEPWTPATYRDASPTLLEEMANVVTVYGSTAVDAALGPTHLLGDPGEAWLDLDVEHFMRLRQALDERQASRIELDYPVIAPLSRFRDAGWRRRVMGAIGGLPIGNLWLRIGGFGIGEERMVPDVIDIMGDFQNLGRPIVLDLAGGIAGLAVLAGGGVNALAYGVATANRFDVRSWRKEAGPPQLDAKAFLLGLDTKLSREEWDDFFSFDECKEFFSCVSHGCCTHNDGAFANPVRHFLHQQIFQLEEIYKYADRSGRFFSNTYLKRFSSRVLALSDMTFQTTTVRKTIAELPKRVADLGTALSRHKSFDAGALLPAPPHRALPANERPPCSPPQMYKPPRPRKSGDREVRPTGAALCPKTSRLL